jgi:hypothetical protein
MPIYTFKLRDGCGGTEDETGINLTAQNEAIRYGHEVVHELMKSREVETRSWCLDVYEDGGRRICEIPFASVDPTLDHLSPRLREMVESVAYRKRTLGDALHAANTTVQESRALVARSRGKPYLASRFGKSTIREI